LKQEKKKISRTKPVQSGGSWEGRGSDERFLKLGGQIERGGEEAKDQFQGTHWGEKKRKNACPDDEIGRTTSRKEK